MKFETYPFEKLNDLLKDIEPNSDLLPMNLTIGEPQFETPAFIQEELQKSSRFLNKYPKSAGEKSLKEAISGFVKRRFGIVLKNEQIIPTFGTREVLFSFPQYFLFDKKESVMAFTNPFYQIYEGAAIASKAKVIYFDLTEENAYKPEIDEEKLKNCDLVILNFPNNPTSSSLSIDELSEWVKLALKYDFVLLNDECYSEIYLNEDKKPPSLLEASEKAGNKDFKNILIINSLSKRSSAPGLRSGFIAGDEQILKGYMQYRTYVGCAVSLPLQYASAAAWENEEHAKKIRENYKVNFDLTSKILGIGIPDSTFYIWLDVDDDIEFTKNLYKEKNVKVVPGSFLGRNGIGKKNVRIALVEKEESTKEALERIKDFIKGSD